MLTLRALARRSLRRGFLLGADQLDAQLQGAAQVLVERLVESPLLGRVEQCALGWVQVQQPVIAVGSDQGTVCRDVACHSGDRQLRE
ncbi:hypothetical protein D3C80_2049590 [compost metagenome]